MMTENALTPLDTAPMPDMLRAHLNLIAQDVQRALESAYTAMWNGEDPEDARTALDAAVTALHEFGDQSIAIQAGLIAYGAAVTEQRNDLIRRDETIRESLEEEIPGLLEIAADPKGYSYSVKDLLQDYVYDTVDTDSIIGEHEDAITTEVQDLMLTLREEGLHDDADKLEEKFGLVAQARDGLSDLITHYTQILNERSEEELSAVEPMDFDDEEAEPLS
jgi:hypothetical protein